MAEDWLNTEELRSRTGIEGNPEVYEIDKGMLQQFVQAVDDPNPLWQDEEYAKKSKYGGIIAPPTFTPIIGFGQNPYMSTSASAETLLHGGTELECYQPVRPGDAITVTTKITNVRERQSQKLGRMVFMTLDTTYKNQRQELVARCRQMLISYKTEGAKHE